MLNHKKKNKSTAPKAIFYFKIKQTKKKKKFNLIFNKNYNNTKNMSEKKYIMKD